MLNTKKLALFILSVGIVTPLSAVNHKLVVTSNPNNKISKIIKAKQDVKNGRKITKFVPFHNTNAEDLFTKIKEQITTTNINIKFNNSSKFDYVIKYGNYDVFGKKHDENQILINKAKNQYINVGSTLLQNTEVKIEQSSKTWHKLSLEHFKKLDLTQVNPESINFYINSSGTKSSPTITLKRSYTNRGDPKIVLTDEIGFYNLNNQKKNLNDFFSKSPLGKFVDVMIAIVIAVILIRIGSKAYSEKIAYDNKKIAYEKWRANNLEAQPWDPTNKQIIADTGLKTNVDTLIDAADNPKPISDVPEILENQNEKSPAKKVQYKIANKDETMEQYGEQKQKRKRSVRKRPTEEKTKNKKASFVSNIEDYSFADFNINILPSDENYLNAKYNLSEVIEYSKNKQIFRPSEMHKIVGDDLQPLFEKFIRGETDEDFTLNSLLLRNEI